MNPAYPGGFEILAAGRPDVVILQHAPARLEYDGFPGYPMHPLATQIQAIELLSGKPVIAVTLNHEDMAREDVPVMCSAIRQTVGSIYMDDKVKDYVLEIVTATREPAAYKLSELAPLIEYGASPRASINLCLAARANAFLSGRGYVTPQDVKEIAVEILRHRVILSYEAEAEEKTTDDVVKKILDSVPVP